jgi:hypothetical protein
MTQLTLKYDNSGNLFLNDEYVDLTNDFVIYDMILKDGNLIITFIFKPYFKDTVLKYNKVILEFKEVNYLNILTDNFGGGPLSIYMIFSSEEQDNLNHFLKTKEVYHNGSFIDSTSFNSEIPKLISISTKNAIDIRFIAKEFYCYSDESENLLN